MSHLTFRKTALAAALLSLGFAVGAAAQTSSGSSTTPGSTTATSPTGKSTANATGGTTSATTTNSAAGMTSSSKATASNLASDDRKFIEKAAQGGMAEVQLGQLAAQKASSDQVKQFAKKMVDDHGKANDQLKQIASAKGVTMPTDLDSSTKREMD